MKQFSFFFLLLSQLLPGSSFPDYQFEALVSNKTYLEFVESLDPASLDVDALRATHIPAYATVVDSVTPGSQGAFAGLRKGWFISAVDGTPAWDNYQPIWREHPKERGRVLTVHSPEGEKKILTMKPGPVGIMHEKSARPDLFVLRNTPKGKWSKHILVAHHAWRRGHHKIAETALSWATKNGMPPNVISTHWAAIRALDKNDFTTSKKLTGILKKALPRDENFSPYFAVGLQTLALAHHDWPFLKSVLAIREHQVDLYHTRQLVLWNHWTPKPGPSLLQRARPLVGENRIADIVPITSDWTKNKTFWGGLQGIDRLKDGLLQGSNTPGHYQAYAFTLPEEMKDVLVSFRAIAGSSGTPKKGKHASFYFSLIDHEGKSQSATRPLIQRASFTSKYVAHLSLYEDENRNRQMSVGGGPAPRNLLVSRDIPFLNQEQSNVALQALKKKEVKWPKPGEVINLQMIRLGNETALYVNGVCFMHLPVNPLVEEIGVCFRFVGAVFRIEDLAVYPLK